MRNGRSVKEIPLEMNAAGERVKIVFQTLAPHRPVIIARMRLFSVLDKVDFLVPDGYSMERLRNHGLAR